jgi:hypothetical protein
MRKMYFGVIVIISLLVLASALVTALSENVSAERSAWNCPGKLASSKGLCQSSYRTPGTKRCPPAKTRVIETF